MFCQIIGDSFGNCCLEIRVYTSKSSGFIETVQLENHSYIISEIIKYKNKQSIVTYHPSPLPKKL